MKGPNRLRILQKEIVLPKWLGVSYRFRLGTFLTALFQLSCWSAVVWVVWNHALTHFFNAGGIGPLLSVGLGAFLYTASMVLDDRES